MTLEFVQPGAAIAPLKAVLYGPIGSGKSVGACTAPGPILYLNSEGPDALTESRRMFGDAKIHEVVFAGKQTLTDVRLYLRNNPTAEKTIVIDSVGECYQLLLAEMGDRPTLQNFGDANILIERFVRDLRNDPTHHLVLVAHEEIKDAAGETIRRPSTGGQKLPEMLMGMVSTVAYCGVVTDEETGAVTYMAQFAQANGRRAKNRGGALGKTRPLDLSEWIQTMRGAAAKEKAK